MVGDDAVLAPELWDRCAGEPDLPDGSRVVVAVDAGIRRDSTAIATVRKDEAGTFHARFKLWTPSRRREVRHQVVERERIAAFTQRHDVVCVLGESVAWRAISERVSAERRAV